jgi:hypothetical protein
LLEQPKNHLTELTEVFWGKRKFFFNTLPNRPDRTDRIIGAVQWAEQARVQSDLLEGSFLIDLSGAEPLFRLAGQPTASNPALA